MKMMKRKILAGVLAFGMATASFALLMPMVAAQQSHIWITSSDYGYSGNIHDAPDGTSPNNGLARHYIQTRPSEVALGPIPPYPQTSHDRVGPMGTSGMTNMAQIDSEGFTTPTVNFDPVIFIAERDKTAPLTFIYPVSVQISKMAGGNIPNGYIASAPVYPFLWAEPLGYGCFDDSYLTKIPSPIYTETSIDWVAMAGMPNIYGYGVLESVSNSGPWTEVGQTTGTTLTYNPIFNDWYSLVIYWAGTGTGFSNMQAVRGTVFGAPSQAWWSPPPPGPIASNLAASGPALDGDINMESVTLSATITAQIEEEIIAGAECRLEGGTIFPMTAQDGCFDESVEDVTYDYWDFPIGFTEGPHVFEVRGIDYENTGGWASSSFSVIDTTPPTAGWNYTPGATSYVNQPLNFSAYYEDFCAIDLDIADSFVKYKVNYGPWNYIPWVNDSFSWGSYRNNLTCSIPGNTFAIGDYVDFYGQVKDTAATPNTQPFGAGSCQIIANGGFFGIPVVTGWNLISFPNIASGLPVTVLDDMGGDTTWSVMKWYNPQTPNDPWKTYRIGGTANDLQAIDNTFGLWLYIIDLGMDGMLCVYGGEPGTTQIVLHTGWNLVGYPTLTNRTVADAFWGTGADCVEIFDSAEPGLIKEVGPTYLMTPGKGYWVHATADAVWTIDW